MRQNDMNAQRLVCPACKRVHFKHAKWRNGDYCSRACYLSLPFPIAAPWVTFGDVERLVRTHTDIKSASRAAGVAYSRFWKVALGAREEQGT
jgi:hypothetical protein